MIVKDVIIPYKQSHSRRRLYCFGDIHLGTIFCAESEAKKQVKTIADDEDALWVGMGDYGEYITPDDPRWDPSSKLVAKWIDQDNIAHDIENRVANLFYPIKDKCVGLMYGNHENSYRKHKFGNVHKNIREKLEVDDLGYVCVVKFKFHRDNSAEKHEIIGAFTHGASGAITQQGKINALKRFMSYFPEADFYGYGHTHTIDSTESISLSVLDNNQVKDKIRHGVLTGCYFKTYGISEIGSYGESKLYPPTRIGCPSFTLNPVTQEAEPDILS